MTTFQEAFLGIMDPTLRAELQRVFSTISASLDDINRFAAVVAASPSSRLYFVSKNGSDTKRGYGGWDYAFAKVATAITAMNARIDWAADPWAVNDILIIAPGTYAENLTHWPYGSMVIGLGWDNRDAQFGVKIKPASGAPLAVSAMINAGLFNLGFESPDASKAFSALVCNNNIFRNVRFSGAAESVTCAQAFYTNDAVCNRWEDCEWTCAAVGFDCAYADANDSFSHNRIIGGRINQATTAGLRMSTNLVGPSSSVEGTVIFGGGQTMAIGVDDNSGILDLFNLRITATDAVQGCRSANGCYGNGTLLNGSGE